METPVKVKNFLATWGWAIPTIMIPLILGAADSRYAKQEALNIMDKILTETVSDISYHHGDAVHHPSFKELSGDFIPRVEISQTLELIQRNQAAQSLKLDGLLKLVATQRK